jgi:hypothetical protein
MGLPRGSRPNLQPGLSGFSRRLLAFSPSGEGRAPKSAGTQTELPPRPTITRSLNAGDMDPIHAGELGMELADRLRR